LGLLADYIVASTWYELRIEKIFFQAGTDEAPL
jgi:hypothetical protein